MNLLIRFNEILHKEKYIFHIHTTYTDGNSSVSDYFEYAYKHNIPYIIFTEHVRRNLSYDFEKFCKDVIENQKRFNNIQSFIGCEAKILPEGKIDIPYNILTKVGIICIACHSFPNDIDLLSKSLIKIFRDRSFKDYIRVWVHAGRFFKKLNILYKYKYLLEELINIAISEDVFIERNLKEDLPPLDILKNIPFNKVVIGYDAHSVQELIKLSRRLIDVQINK